MIIVGIYIAKRIHSASIVHQSGEARGNAISFHNTNEGLEKLLQYVKRYNPKHEEVVFRMETTGHYWLALYDSSLKAMPFMSLTRFKPTA